MRRVSIISILLVFAIGGSVAWQIGASELANVNLRDDLHDIAANVGAHIGLAPPSSDSQVIETVIRKAREHWIELQPDQVTVRRIGSGPTSTFYLAADYHSTVNLLLFSFDLHFTPSSEK